MSISDMLDEFKHSKTKEKVRYLMQDNEEYMFTIREISLILEEDESRVRNVLHELKDEGYVEIAEKGKTKEVGNEWYEREEDYWSWSGYL